MKKCVIVTVLCLVTSLFLFGDFNEIRSSSGNTAELGKTLDDAEKGIDAANGAMSHWKTELAKDEPNAIRSRHRVSQPQRLSGDHCIDRSGLDRIQAGGAFNKRRAKNTAPSNPFLKSLP